MLVEFNLDSTIVLVFNLFVEAITRGAGYAVVYFSFPMPANCKRFETMID